MKALQTDEDLSEKLNRVSCGQLVHRTDDWYSRMKVSPEVQAKIKEHVDKKFSASDVDERIEKRVSHLVDQEIERRAQEKFEKRMADIRAMMG